MKPNFQRLHAAFLSLLSTESTTFSVFVTTMAAMLLRLLLLDFASMKFLYSCTLSSNQRIMLL